MILDFNSFLNESNQGDIFVISLGVINIQSGKTKYDWSIYDDENEGKEVKTSVYLTNGGSLLYASTGTFKDGDIVNLRYNDSRRLIASNVTIKGSCPCIKDEVVKFLYDNGYDYRVKRAFTKSHFSRKLGTSFSVK